MRRKSKEKGKNKTPEGVDGLPIEQFFPPFAYELSVEGEAEADAVENAIRALVGVENDDLIEAVGPLRGADWRSTKVLCDTLRHFYVLTKIISASKYVTSNFYFDHVENVATILKKWEMSPDMELRKIGLKMREKYDKYWGKGDNALKFNTLTFIAAVFDPRKKFNYVKFSLARVHGRVDGNRLAEKVSDDMERLYQAYCQIYLKQSDTSVGTSSSNPSSVDVSSSLVERMEVAGLDEAELQKMYDSYTLEREQAYDQAELVDSGDAAEHNSELKSYLQEAKPPKSNDFSILDWWKLHSPRLPVLSRMARDILAVQVSTVASESAFSTGGRVLDPFRSSLKPSLVQSLICAQDWFRSPSSIPPKKEEDPADLDEDE